MALRGASDDTTRSVDQLTGRTSPATSEPDSGVVQRACKPGTVPLKPLSQGDLRFLIVQRAGLDLVVPLALEMLRQEPLVDSEYYEGDLLWAVLDLHPDMWQPKAEIATVHPNAVQRTVGLLSRIDDNERADHLTRRTGRRLHFFHQSAGFSHGAADSSRA